MRHSVLIFCVNISLEMKLFIVLSVIACGYAAKLDRTYLPPASAATAGGSPGSLAAPFGSAPTQGFGQSNFGASPGPSGFGSAGQSPAFGKTGPSNSPQASFGQNSLEQPARPGTQYGPPSSSGISQTGVAGRGSGPSFGLAAFGQNAPIGPAGNSASGFGSSNFGQGQSVPAQSQPERPQASADRTAEILRYENENDGNTFSYSFETSNGISAEESGVATNGVQAQGGYSYTADDGEVYRVTYTADENGYQPQGDHLPTSPPIPDEILRSIEENARAAAAGTQEGAYQPDDNESGNSPQQYSGSSPSYNQGQSSAQSFNQPQGTHEPSQQYGTPNAPSRPGSFNQAQSGSSNQFSGSSLNQASTGSIGQAPSQFGGSSASGRGSAQNTQFGSQSNIASSSGPAQRSQGNDNGYQYDRPQGAPGSFASSRQDQSSAQSRPQQYGAASRGSNQGPSQQYGAPAIGGSSQQYNAPSSFGQGSQQAASAPTGSNRPSQQYGAPASSSLGSVQGSRQQYNAPVSAQGAPNTQRPSQEYGSPIGTNQAQFGSPSSSAPSGQAGFTGSFQAPRRDQSPAQSRPQSAVGRGSQAQDNNGYQYNRPQGAPFGQGPSNIRSQPSGQQSSAPQYNQGQSTFPTTGPASRPGASSGNFGAGPTTGPAAALVNQPLLPGSRGQGPVSPSIQGSFGSTSQSKPGFMAGPSQFNQSGGPSRQGSQQGQSIRPAAPTFGGPRQPPSFSPENGYVY